MRELSKEDLELQSRLGTSGKVKSTGLPSSRRIYSRVGRWTFESRPVTWMSIGANLVQSSDSVNVSVKPGKPSDRVMGYMFAYV